MLNVPPHLHQRQRASQAPQGGALGDAQEETVGALRKETATTRDTKSSFRVCLSELARYVILDGVFRAHERVPLSVEPVGRQARVSLSICCAAVMFLLPPVDIVLGDITLAGVRYRLRASRQRVRFATFADGFGSCFFRFGWSQRTVDGADRSTEFATVRRDVDFGCCKI